MTFQFRCPSGHLLEAEDHDVGQVVNCPVCATAMAIPPNPAGPPVAAPISPTAMPPQAYTAPPAAHQYEAPAPEAYYEETPEVEAFPDVTGDEEFATDEFSVDTGEESVGDSEIPDFDGEIENKDELHIPCPNGHVLAVTRDLLQEEAICPHCDAEFELVERNSIEAKQKRAEQADRRAEKAERVFLYWGIGVAVIVVGTIIGLAIAYSK